MFTLIILSQNLHAKRQLVFIPYLGGEFGSWSQNYGIPVGRDLVTVGSKGASTAYQYGSKFYYQWGYVFAGMDFHKAQGKWDYFQASPSFDDEWRKVNYNRLHMSGFAGLTFGKRNYSLWMGRSLKHSLSLEENINPEDTPLTYEGNSSIIGFGFNYDSHLRFEFEYVKTIYDTLEKDGGRTKLPSFFKNFYYDKLNTTSYIFRVSYMFSFLETIDYASDWIWRRYR